MVVREARRAGAAGGRGRGRAARHRPDVRRQRGQARRVRRARGGARRRSRRCARCPGCEEAAEIGEVKTEPPGMVLVETAFGGKRVMDQLVGDPLPQDLLSERTSEEDAWPAVEFVPNQQADGGGHRPRALDDDGSLVRGRLGRDDRRPPTRASRTSSRAIIPGMPRVVIHNQVIAYEVGQEYIQAWYDAEAGQARPVRPDHRGLDRQREDQRRGPLDGLRRATRDTGQPITTNEWVDRLAQQGGRGRRDRHLRDLRRHPGDEEQPDRRDGPARLPRLELEVEGRPARSCASPAARRSPTT